jgi:hypothetical protein
MAPRPEKGRDLLASLREAAVEPVEGPEEIGEVGEEAEAEDVVGEPEGGGGPAGGAGKGTGEERVAVEEPASIVLEELHHPAGRTKSSPAAGRNEQEIDPFVPGVLVEASPHVFEDAGKGVDKAGVEPVPMDQVDDGRRAIT